MGSKFIQGVPVRLDVVGSEILTVGTTVQALTPPADQDIISVFIEVQGNAVRWMAFGNPTASAGHYLAAGETAVLMLDPDSLRFVRDTAASGDATLVVDYLGI